MFISRMVFLCQKILGQVVKPDWIATFEPSRAYASRAMLEEVAHALAPLVVRRLAPEQQVGATQRMRDSKFVEFLIGPNVGGLGAIIERSCIEVE